jgi:hypothetical protein
MDLRRAAHYLKLLADQGNASGQLCYGVCLRPGDGVPIDLRGEAASLCNIFIDEKKPTVQCQSRFIPFPCLLPRCDVTSLIQSFELSADNSNFEGQLGIGWMTEHGIGTPMDLAKAARYYDLLCDRSTEAWVLSGRCYQIGRGVPLDFTLAVEFFQKAAESRDADGENSFGCCCENGDGLERDIR